MSKKEMENEEDDDDGHASYHRTLASLPSSSAESPRHLTRLLGGSFPERCASRNMMVLLRASL